MMPEYRVGQAALKRCLSMSLEHMIENVEPLHLLGSCTHVLGRLYRRFGFSVVAANVPLEGTEKCYSLIHGKVPVVAAALQPGTENVVS